MEDKDRVDQAFEEIRAVRAQAKADFDFSLLVFREFGSELKAVSAGLKDLGVRLDVAAANLEERLNQVEGRNRLRERRFDGMLEAVDQRLSQFPTRSEFEELRERVEELERKGSQPPAA